MEEWRDIKGFEGKYKVSNLGRVKSLERFVKPTAPGQQHKTCKEKILKDCVSTHGYKHVSLEGKKFCVHKLVALSFFRKSQ